MKFLTAEKFRQVAQHFAGKDVDEKTLINALNYFGDDWYITDGRWEKEKDGNEVCKWQ